MQRSTTRRLALAAALAGVAISGEAGHYRWTTSGPEPGLITQVVVNPGNSDRLAAVAGFYGSFLFWSSDRGLTWSEDENLSYAAQLVQDPSRPDILYATGTTGAFTGVVKTVNGGASWAPSSSGLPPNAYGPRLALAPSAPDVLYAAISGSPGQVYRSTDGGASWIAQSSTFSSNYVADLQVDPVDSTVVYAVAGPTGILKSVDSGVTWNEVGSLPSATRLLVDPTSPSTVYAGTSDAGIAKSIDAGMHWTPWNTGIETASIRAIAADPADPQRLWIAAFNGSAGPGGVYRTSDGGQTWSYVDLGAPTPNASAVALDPRSASLVYAAGSQSILRGGLFATADGGQTWAARSSGISGYYSYGIASDATEPGTAFAITSANVSRTADAGSVWTLSGTAPFALLSLVQDPANPQTLYGGYVGSGAAGVLKSPDSGATWSPTGTFVATNLYQVSISPSASDHLLAAAFEGLFGTTDGGGSWTPLLPGQMRSGAYDPADPSILYAGAWISTATGDGLLRSTDGGLTWNPPAGVPTAYPHVLDIDIPKDDPSHVYAAFGQGVYRSIDRGLSFAPASTGLPGGFWPTELAGDPTDPATLYAAGAPSPGAAPSGTSPDAAAPSLVYRTRDSADHWIPVPGFLPVLTGPLDFAVAADGRTLYAATLSGVFQFSRSFADVPDSDLFWSAVDAAAMNGVTAGCGSGNFCPTSPTSRASVAAFLLHGKNGGSYSPPPATGTVFGDVPAGSLAADFIEELFHDGITAGCGGGDYCPSEPVTRAGMAVLVLKTLNGSGFVPPPATGTVFADVPIDAFAADWIEELFHEGISAGCGGGNYCPDASLTRAQASALVVRAFGLS